MNFISIESSTKLYSYLIGLFFFVPFFLAFSSYWILQRCLRQIGKLKEPGAAAQLVQFRIFPGIMLLSDFPPGLPSRSSHLHRVTLNKQTNHNLL